MRSLSRASSMSTSSMSLDSVASMATTASDTGEMASDVDSSGAEDTVQGAGSVLNAEDELKRSLQGLQDFFKFRKLESSKESQKYADKKQLHKGMANCQKCGQTIKFDSESRGNLKKHYKTKHPGMVKALEAAMSLNKFKARVGPKSNKACRQLTLKEATQKPNVWSQEAAQQAYVVWFAESLKPLCDTDDEATWTFLKTLKPEFKVPCRKTLTNRLNKYSLQVKNEVIACLDKVEHVATTADSWSSHRRAFLGSTVHWIDPVTLQRKSATLACRELTESQTGEMLARNLHEIFTDHNIADKITGCTTDNGRNYISAFEQFAGDPTIKPQLTEEEEDDQNDQEMAPNASIRDVAGLLAERTAEERNETLLPRHFKCRTAINKILSVQGLGLFDSKDTEVIKEYLQVMTPVAICLDRMQSDTAAYMGNLLPDLMLLRQRLETVKNSNLRYAGNLVEYLLEQDDHRHGFYKRFGGLFDEDDLLMATATHPAHTLHAINYLNEAAYTTIKNRVIREMVDIVKPDSFQEEAAESADAGDKQFGYDDLYVGHATDATAPASTPWRKASAFSHQLGEDQGACGQEGALFPKATGRPGSSCFIRDNTALPSSAAAERLFSTAGNILRPKRSSLTASNFEQLVLLKGNSRMFKAALKEDLKKGPDTHQDQE
ncbi:Zinc finger BED domain-containing protein 1 [Chionoecetes opilio]|uniref:Zinc finger BED domain-containing protein 1 n=1 Tax=Chionoecetes opilio TaxID=41210 RepID=A0A8J4XTY6_CHIOP|nr:Zinc finger BED domain-containing protein 1 [Chionoecetes opilio]